MFTLMCGLIISEDKIGGLIGSILLDRFIGISDMIGTYVLFMVSLRYAQRPNQL